MTRRLRAFALLVCFVAATVPSALNGATIASPKSLDSTSKVASVFFTGPEATPARMAESDRRDFGDRGLNAPVVLAFLVAAVMGIPALRRLLDGSDGHRGRPAALARHLGRSPPLFSTPVSH